MVRAKSKKTILKRNVPLILMVLPAIILMTMFTYVPKFGAILAFKEYDYQSGIFGSPWSGLENFRYLFSSGDLWNAIRNTVGYHIANSLIIKILEVLIAIGLYMISQKAAKRYQFVITMPYLVSFNIIASVVYLFLRYDGGIVNRMLEMFGQNPQMWYLKPGPWPYILVFINAWFGAGIGSIYYYSIMMGIDHSVMEAIDIDGGTWKHKIRYVMLPSIVPLVCLFLIRDMGSVLSSNFSLFYSIPMDSTALYNVTTVLSTYEYRGLQMGNIGTTAALGLVTGIVQAVMLHMTNGIVKKVSPDNSMY